MFWRINYSTFQWGMFGCGSKPMVPFWGRCTTHFRLLGCSLGVRDFDPWPFDSQGSPFPFCWTPNVTIFLEPIRKLQLFNGTSSEPCVRGFLLKTLTDLHCPWVVFVSPRIHWILCKVSLQHLLQIAGINRFLAYVCFSLCLVLEGTCLVIVSSVQGSNANQNHQSIPPVVSFP